MPHPLRTAVVLGGTGLVGSSLLALLDRDAEVAQIVTLGRRAPAGTSTKRTDVVVDLGVPASYRAHLDVDCVFCALGTTIKTAGSEEAFRRVDHTYPLAVAQAAAAAGARRFAVVSAVGADARSSIFYNKVKGELEEALRALSFSGGVRILHPSLLLGERQESRPGERVASVLMRATAPLFAGGLKKYRAIGADDVARALVTAARSDGASVTVYEGGTLFEAAAACRG